MGLPLVRFSRRVGGWVGGGGGRLPLETRLHLKGREPRLHRLQKVGQEVDGAGHACEEEVMR